MSSPSIGSGPGPENGAADLADEVVTISRIELEELRASARAASQPRREGDPLEAKPPGPIGEAAARREEALTKELAARDRRVADLESAYRKALRDRELATALAGRPLVAGAASQLIKLWCDDFDVYEESGDYKVVARDGRTVAQWVAERLAGADHAHFCLPTSRGGVGAKGLSQSGATDNVAPGARTLGEAIVSQWRESAATRVGPKSGSAGWGRRRQS
jgi:hypothetical protein